MDPVLPYAVMENWILASQPTHEVLPDIFWDFFSLVDGEETEWDILEVVEILEVPVDELGSTILRLESKEALLVVVLTQVFLREHIVQ
jgi:hypothetical protein